MLAIQGSIPRLFTCPYLTKKAYNGKLAPLALWTRSLDKKCVIMDVRKEITLKACNTYVPHIRGKTKVGP